MILKILLLIACAVFCEAELESRIVYTSQGPVRGYKKPSDDVFVFYEIPYATAPTGPHKFKAPLPPPTWDEPFEAVQNNIVCPQPIGEYDAQNNTFKVQEDCLITTIYTPDIPELNLPVMVNFHGGAFQFGYGLSQIPMNLVKSKKIIAVDFNYRLGLHGFLCLGTEDVPGNAGLKDQVALLRWIQKNIASFGGNPNDVTITGCSAGASSIDLMVLSPITKGLFHKVIPASAAGIAAITFQIDPIENAKLVANQLNFNHGNDIKTLEALFKNASYADLINVDVSSMTDRAVLISPCIERDVGDEMVVKEDPFNIMRKGDFPKLPTLYGISDKEGKYRLSNLEMWKDLMNEKFANFLPQDLGFSSEEEKKQVAQEVKEFYFGNEPVGKDSILGYVDYFTDTMFAYGVARAAKLQVEAGNKEVYLYEYDFVADFEEYIPHTNIRGAQHCAQFFAVFDDASSEENLSDDNKRMKKIMRDLWLNFITKGAPGSNRSPFPEWHPINELTSPYMSLNITPSFKPEFLHPRAEFWNKIYSKYYKGPVPPST